MTTETYKLITLGRSSIVKDHPDILKREREYFHDMVERKVADYEHFSVTTRPEFTEVLHLGPECAFEDDDGKWIEFDFRHYHLSASWEVCHDLLVDKLQWLFKPFGEKIEVVDVG